MTRNADGSHRLPALLEPLREPTFRALWAASLLSNFGQLVQGVGAAWEMTRLTPEAEMVALVQTAIMLPLMLLSLPAGAIADMYDRRRVALAGLSFAFLGAVTLGLCAYADILTPWVLLSLCFAVGAGVALYGPAWQASISEQVSPERVPAAVALGSISYNVARSVGPAIGGVIVATVGAAAAFGANALLYTPVIVAFLAWRRVPVPSRLPPERIDRAIVAGLRYAFHSPPIRIVLIRTGASALAGSSVAALTPLVAKQVLGGGASTYGLLLGAFGVGAVLGALFVDRVRERVVAEAAVRSCAIITGGMIIAVGMSHHLATTLAALVVAGASWMLMVALFNVGVQLSAPRWVTARVLACWGTALTGGMAVGAWVWGQVASQWGVGNALVLSGFVLALSAVIGLLLPMPRVASAEAEMTEGRIEPEVGLALTLRSGPIVIEVDYQVEGARAREFYSAMQDVRQARLRSGAFDWSLSRDIAEPHLWTERYHCPTWGDYLRQRSRATQSDLRSEDKVRALQVPDALMRVRRRLERPFGSVRWQAGTPDGGGPEIPMFSP